VLKALFAAAGWLLILLISSNEQADGDLNGLHTQRWYWFG
jgi:hypothetical protein